MSLLSSSSFMEDKKALIDLRDKENDVPMSPIYSFAQVGYKSGGNGWSEQNEELSFRAKSLEVQLMEAKQNELKFKRELESERALKRVIETELGEVKEYMMRQQRLQQGQELSQKKSLQELGEARRKINEYEVELTNERIRNRVDSDRQRQRAEQLDSLRKQLHTVSMHLQESKRQGKEQEQRLQEHQKLAIQLKFQKNSLVQQLKMEKYQREVSFRENNKQKCEQFLSVTRQLNQMSVECAKWRTQWEELRSKEEGGCWREKSQLTSMQLEQEKLIFELRERLEEKQKLESLSIEESLKLNEEVVRIKESERVRKEEMIKKDRYVLKLEAETKKFEEQCQARIKEVEEAGEERIRDLQVESQRVSQQNQSLRGEIGILKERIKNGETSETLKNQQYRMGLKQLQDTIAFLKEEIERKDQILLEKESECERNLTITSQLSHQLTISSQQNLLLSQSQKDTELHYQNLIISIKIQLSQKFSLQKQSLISQLSSQEQQLRDLQIQNQYIKSTIGSYQQSIENIQGQRDAEARRHKVEKERLKKIIVERDIMIRVAKSESAGIQQIMNEEMDKRNQVIEQLVRETKGKNC